MHFQIKLHDLGVCTIITIWVRRGQLVEMLSNSWTVRYILIIFCIQMHVNIVSPLAYMTAFLVDEGLLSIVLACWSQLLNRMVYLDQILHTYLV